MLLQRQKTLRSRREEIRRNSGSTHVENTVIVGRSEQVLSLQARTMFMPARDQRNKLRGRDGCSNENGGNGASDRCCCAAPAPRARLQTGKQQGKQREVPSGNASTRARRAAAAALYRQQRMRSNEVAQYGEREGNKKTTVPNKFHTI